MREEHQRETEGLLDNIRETSKELKLLQLTMDSCIPYEFQVYTTFIFDVFNFENIFELFELHFCFDYRTSVSFVSTFFV